MEDVRHSAFQEEYGDLSRQSLLLKDSKQTMESISTKLVNLKFSKYAYIISQT